MTDHDQLRALLGVPFDDARLDALLEVFAPIREEIEKLRSLDLTDVHPAVVFDPTAAYPQAQPAPELEP